MTCTFITTSITESELKLLKLNHTAEIYTKHHLTNKFLNYDFILGRDTVYKLGIMFDFENKTITWLEVLISMKPHKKKACETYNERIPQHVETPKQSCMHHDGKIHRI